MKKIFFQFAVFFCALTIYSSTVFSAVTANFNWKAQNICDTCGYIVYYGYSSREHSSWHDAGNPTSMDGRVHTSITNLEYDTLYYFDVVAYDENGKETTPSWELTYLTPPSELNASFPVWKQYLNDDTIQDTIFIDDDGVYVIYGSNTTTNEPIYIIDGFGLVSGWNPVKHVIVIIDFNSDGHKDICGFGGAGLIVATNNGDDTFSDPYLAIEAFGYNSGWKTEHSRNFIDINNDGYIDIVGWRDNVHWTSLSLSGLYFEDIIEW